MSAAAWAICGVIFGLSVVVLFAISIYRTRDRDADSVEKISKNDWDGLADVIRAVRGG